MITIQVKDKTLTVHDGVDVSITDDGITVSPKPMYTYIPPYPLWQGITNWPFLGNGTVSFPPGQCTTTVAATSGYVSVRDEITKQFDLPQ